MAKIYLCVLFIVMTFLFSCSGNNNEDDSNKIVLVGEAVNMKGGVGVVSNDIVYHFDRVNRPYSWDKEIVGKKIRVEGELFVEILSPRPPPDTINVPPPPPMQRGAYDFNLIVRNCQWKVVNGGDTNHIRTNGTAENSNSGAIVISDSIVYQVDGLDAWDEEFINKRIQIEGELIVEYLLPKNPDDLPPYDYLLIIKNAKW